MKNIHIIPTDKPSRLYQKDGNFKLNTSVAIDWFISSIGYKPQNMYITSDEKIKEGDWYYALDTKYIKIKQSWENSHLNFKGKKIILTTDQGLINEGVQPIDGEFLKWFVKNPSIDEVEVSYGVLKPFQNTDKGYMIHLPDNDVLEEPKTKCYCGHTTYCDCGPEQELDILEVPMPIYKETLEEAGVAYVKTVNQNHTSHMLGFHNGAKWQAERSYSEEDMIEASKYGYNFHKTTQFQNQEFEDSCIRNTQQWLTQFKKK